MMKVRGTPTEYQPLRAIPRDFPRRHWASMMTYKLADRMPVPVEDFAEWCQWYAASDRTIARTEIGALTVSTVFLGIIFDWGERALMFETMVFGDPQLQYQRQYTTYDDAEDGHQLACEWVEEKLKR